MLIRWLLYCFTIYLAFAFFAYFLSNILIFPIQKSSYRDTKDILKITTHDGAMISAIYLPNSNATYTVLVSHGNAEDLGQIMPFLKMFHAQGLAIFAYDYHGYGTSTGSPSEKNTYADIDAAYDYLVTQLHVLPNHIILYGRSLGAAAAIDLAARKPVVGLIIESPFVTAFRTITKIPLLPFDKFDNLKKIKSVKCRVLIIHGKRDHIISFWHGKKLYREINSSKDFFWVNNADHNNVVMIAGSTYWNVIDNFIQKLGNQK